MVTGFGFLWWETFRKRQYQWFRKPETKKNGKHKKIIWLLMKKMQKKTSLFIPSRFVELMEYNVHKLWTLKVIR